MRNVAITGLFLMGIAGCNYAAKEAPAPVPHTANSLVKDTSDDSSVQEGRRASSPDDPVEGKKNPTDEEITENIRQKLLKSEMAVNLGNVKVSTQDGKVSLQGLVKTAEEKQKVEEIARATAGDYEVYSELAVE